MTLKIQANSRPQVDFFAASEYEVLFGGAAGGGKQLRVDEPVPTPWGWTTMGELEAGSIIFGGDGCPCKVVLAHPVTTPAITYRLNLSDGSTIEACADHLWLTFNAAERAQLQRRTDVFRADRREKRPSRVAGHKSQKFTASLIARNKQNPPSVLSPQSGSLRTTQQIYETLLTKRGAINHSIRVAGELQIPSAVLPLEPYLLGLWLGDGTSSAGAITTADVEIVHAFQSRGFEVVKYSDRYGYGVHGLVTILRSLGVLNNKHIPPQYLRASVDQRLSLLQGLMDTDGTVAKNSGAAEFSTTSAQLANGAHELIVSLGWKVRMREDRAMLYGRDCGPAWTMKWVASKPVFRLSRKLELQRLSTRLTRQFRYIENCEVCESSPMRCITVDSADGMYLVGRQMIPTHNTFALVVDPLRYVEVADFTASIYRRTYPELERSVIPLAQKIYCAAGATYNDQKKLFVFPSGATIRLGFMQSENDWLNYQGDEQCGQYFDELTNFTEAQYTNIAPWNRSRAMGIPAYRRAASNPGGVGHSFVKRHFVDSCPPVKDGSPRHSAMARMSWQPMKPGPAAWSVSENGMILTRKYIPSRVFDNEDLLKKNPLYLAQLLNMPEQKRKAYLEGDWDVFEGQFFSEWRREVHVIPAIREPIPEDYAVMGVIDYGERTVLEVGFRDTEGTIVTFAECYTESMSPSERFNAMADMLIERQLFNLPIRYDTNMDINLKNYTGYEHTQASIARGVFQDRMKKQAPSLSVVSKATSDRRGYRAVANEAMREHLAWEKNPDGTFKRRPRHFVTEDCKHLISTLPELLHDPDSPDGLDFIEGKDVIDDPYDADKMLLMGLATPKKKDKPKPPVNVGEFMDRIATVNRSRVNADHL